MNLTDFYFLCAFALILLIYYLVPKKLQWGVLLLASIAYYVLNGEPVLILYPVLSVILCWEICRFFASLEGRKGTEKVKFATLVTGVILLLLVLVLLKYLRFTSFVDLLVPLGLSYYTFTLIGYIVDVYYGIAEPQTNLLKLMCFGMYFPALVSGPIMQYREVRESFFAEHRFNLQNLTYGMQRMLWGFFKKLVIAERLGVFVAAVYEDPATYGGVYVWLAILAFTFQLYTDFSGLMDIVLGISQCFGIVLPENFKTPFFSRTISEYWRRWHMTLGVWFKEYVFYRILRTSTFGKLQKALRDRLGKKKGKQISTFIAMFVLWLIIGLWHGGNMTYVIGSGLLHWFYIVMEEVLEPPFTKLWKRLNIATDAKWLDKLRILRTFILVNIGNAFFRAASVGDAVKMFGYGFSEHKFAEAFGSGIGGGVFSLGLDWIQWGVTIVSLVALLVVSLVQKKIEEHPEQFEMPMDGSGCVRDLIAKKTIVIRFIIWFALLFYVILLGQYGPGYSAAEFIYQGF